MRSSSAEIQDLDAVVLQLPSFVRRRNQQPARTRPFPHEAVSQDREARKAAFLHGFRPPLRQGAVLFRRPHGVGVVGKSAARMGGLGSRPGAQANPATLKLHRFNNGVAPPGRSNEPQPRWVKASLAEGWNSRGLWPQPSEALP